MLLGRSDGAEHCLLFRNLYSLSSSSIPRCHSKLPLLNAQVRNEAEKGCLRVLLRGPGGGRPEPAAFAESCLGRLGVRAVVGGSSGCSSSDSSSDSGGGNAACPNVVTLDWRLAEALLKLVCGLATALKKAHAFEPPTAAELQAAVAAVPGVTAAAAAEKTGSEAAAAAGSVETAATAAAATAELSSVLGRPGLAAALLPMLAHDQASVRYFY